MQSTEKYREQVKLLEELQEIGYNIINCNMCSSVNIVEKNKETFPNVSLVAIPPQFGRISGTDTRKKIQDNDLESLNFIPDQVHWTDKEVIYKDILGLTVKKVS